MAECNSFVTELTYIHSKIMIVYVRGYDCEAQLTSQRDDLKVVIGSANLNDRSMKGDGDSVRHVWSYLVQC